MKLQCLLIISIVSILSEAKLCPDHKSRCSSANTCCQTGPESYGCCPYESAVCCSDGRHCCPNGSQCDVAHSRCVQSQTNIPYYPFLSTNTKWAEHESDEILNEIEDSTGDKVDDTKKKPCPDGKQKCPDTWTCCPTSDNGYACCPFTDGVCCSDFTHCCENGKKCNLASGSCD